MIEIQIQDSFSVFNKIDQIQQDKLYVTFFLTHSTHIFQLLRSQKLKESLGYKHQNSKLIGKVIKLIMKALENQLPMQRIRDAIVMLNSLINLDNRYIEDFQFNIKNLEKLSQYFIQFFINFQNNNEKNNLSGAISSTSAFELYSIIYLTTLILAEARKRLIQEQLMNKFLTKNFIHQFLMLDITSIKKNEIYRLISIILMFIVKKIKIKDFQFQFKNFVFLHLSELKDKKTQLPFIYSLRILNQDKKITQRQVTKFKLVQFLIPSIQGQVTENHFTYACDIIKNLIKQHRIFGYQFLRLGLLNILQSKFNQYPRTVSLVIIQLPKFLNEAQLLELCLHYEKLFFNKGSENSKNILRCLSSLISGYKFENIIELIEKGIFDRIEELTKNNLELELIEQIFEFFEKLIQAVQKIHLIYGWELEMKIEKIIQQKIECMDLTYKLKDSTDLLLNYVYERFQQKHRN